MVGGNTKCNLSERGTMLTYPILKDRISDLCYNTACRSRAYEALSLVGTEFCYRQIVCGAPHGSCREDGLSTCKRHWKTLLLRVGPSAAEMVLMPNVEADSEILRLNLRSGDDCRFGLLSRAAVESARAAILSYKCICLSSTSTMIQLHEPNTCMQTVSIYSYRLSLLSQHACYAHIR